MLKSLELKIYWVLCSILVCQCVTFASRRNKDLGPEFLRSENLLKIKSWLSDKFQRNENNCEGNNSQNEDSKLAATNAIDYDLRDLLNQSEMLIDRNLEVALGQFQTLFDKFQSPRALFNIAKCYFKLQDFDKSGKAFCDLFFLQGVPEFLLAQAATGCLKWAKKKDTKVYVDVLKILVATFPSKGDYSLELSWQLMLNMDLEEAEVHLEAQNAFQPNLPLPSAMLGLCEFLLSNGDIGGRKLMKVGQNNLQVKKMHGYLAKAYRRLNRPDLAELVYAAGFENGHFLSKWQRSSSDQNLICDVKSKPVWNISETGQELNLRMLSQHWELIRDEAIAAFTAQHSEYSHHRRSWQQMILFENGKINSQTCPLAPQTCHLFKEHLQQLWKDIFLGQVKFSIVHPETHIKPHSGPTNCRLRAHLGLDIPSKVWMRIADRNITWSEGDIFIIDDSFEHEVWNKDVMPRLVLLVDLWHPEVQENQKTVLKNLKNTREIPQSNENEFFVNIDLKSI